MTDYRRPDRIATVGGWFAVTPDGRLAVIEDHALPSLWPALKARGFRVATWDDLAKARS